MFCNSSKHSNYIVVLGYRVSSSSWHIHRGRSLQWFPVFFLLIALHPTKNMMRPYEYLLAFGEGSHPNHSLTRDQRPLVIDFVSFLFLAGACFGAWERIRNVAARAPLFFSGWCFDENKQRVSREDRRPKLCSKQNISSGAREQALELGGWRGLVFFCFCFLDPWSIDLSTSEAQWVEFFFFGDGWTGNRFSVPGCVYVEVVVEWGIVGPRLIDVVLSSSFALSMSNSQNQNNYGRTRLKCV